MNSESSYPNVIVFGQTGAGKSSLINMLAGKRVAEVSNKAGGNTTSSHRFDISNRDGITYRFWDTPGLNEGEEGNIPSRKAMDGICDLLKELSTVNLVIYCVRGSRFTEIVRVNYDLFWRVVCEGKVPIVLVVTGLEQESDMDSWWRRNKGVIKQMDMTFAGHACVTTTDGPRGIYKTEYQESADKVWDLVRKHHDGNPVPWRTTAERLEGANKKIDKYMTEYNARSWRSWKLVRAFGRLVGWRF